MTAKARLRALERKARYSRRDEPGVSLLTVKVYGTEEELRRDAEARSDATPPDLRATRAGLDKLLEETEAKYHPQRVIFLIGDTETIDAPYPPEVDIKP